MFFGGPGRRAEAQVTTAACRDPSARILRGARHRALRARPQFDHSVRACGSQDNEAPEVRRCSRAEKEDPGRTDRLFRSLQNVTVSHLADRALFDFENVGADD